MINWSNQFHIFYRYKSHYAVKKHSFLLCILFYGSIHIMFTPSFWASKPGRDWYVLVFSSSLCLIVFLICFCFMGLHKKAERNVSSVKKGRWGWNLAWLTAKSAKVQVLTQTIFLNPPCVHLVKCFTSSIWIGFLFCSCRFDFLQEMWGFWIFSSFIIQVPYNN